MARLLTKKLACLSSHSSSLRRELSFATPLLLFSTQIQQKEESSFMAEYLISSFGFSEERSLRTATDKRFAAIKNPERPDSVVRFLKDNGLTDKEIKSLISWNPRFLCSNVEKTLKPRASELMKSGFGGNIFIELIKSNPLALTRTTTLSVLQFWRNFVGNKDKALLNVIKMNSQIINLDIDKKIVPRINLLREYGLSDQQIGMVVLRARSFILRDLDNMKRLLEETVNLGFQRGSTMFVYGLIVVASFSKDTLIRKMNFFKNTYNFSEEDVKSVFNKNPYILKISEENVKSTMDFLLSKFGFDSRNTSLLPLLQFSLKRRLIPRHYVVTMLKSKGLKINYCSSSVIRMSEKQFVEKCIVPYEKEVPGLGDSYAALCDAKLSP